MAGGGRSRSTPWVFRACFTCATTATAGISRCWHWRATATCATATRARWHLASDPSVGVVVGLAAEARIAGRLGWLVAVGGGTAAGAKTAARSLADAGVGALVS